MSVWSTTPNGPFGLARARRSFIRRRWWPAVLLLLLVTTACSVAEPIENTRATASPASQPADATTTQEPGNPERAAATPEPTETVAPDAGTPTAGDGAGPESTPGAEPSPVAELGARLAPAPVGFEALASVAAGPQPIGLTIESIGVDEALVIPVGVNPDDDSMEIPPADEVGWYRFGSLPGDDGSAVLAAHIAYDGRDGVFRRLTELTPGSVVVIEFDDASTQRWVVETVTDYNKTKLPDELFAVDGDPQLALITCGGYFNPGLRSYDSNTVAVARPL